MYYTIRDIWMYGKSMYGIRTQYGTEASYFTDIDALGVFVDNHDNARFLHDQSNHAKFKGALAFVLTSRGIPFFYYGDEQGYAGGNDPLNREPLWTNLYSGSDIYKYVATINAARKSHKIWN